MRRKARALEKWRRVKGKDGWMAARAFIKHFNRKLYTSECSSEVNWSWWYFPLITTDKSLTEIDAYMQDCVRYIATTEEAQEDDTALQIDNERLFEALTKELNLLSAPEQLLFDLRFTDELSIKEIAAIFSIPDGTVKSRLHTLTLKLRKKLEDYA